MWYDGVSDWGSLYGLQRGVHDSPAREIYAPAQLNPQPPARNPKSETPEPVTRNPGTRNPEPETRNPKPETRNPGTRSPKFETPEPEARNSKPGNRNPISETPEPEIHNPTPDRGVFTTHLHEIFTLPSQIVISAFVRRFGVSRWGITGYLIGVL